MDLDDLESEDKPRIVPTVTDVRLLFATALSARPGGLSTPDCIGHLTIIDMPQEQAWMVPLTSEALHGLIGEMEHILKSADKTCQEDQSQ